MVSRDYDRYVNRESQYYKGLEATFSRNILSKMGGRGAKRESILRTLGIIHLVMDNLSSQTRKALVERFGEKAGGWLWDRFTVHYTPKHGSWLNQAEIAISLFSRQCLGRRRIADRASLRKETQAWSRRMNRHRVAIQ